jgi:hypothetical protein
MPIRSRQKSWVPNLCRNILEAVMTTQAAAFLQFGDARE